MKIVLLIFIWAALGAFAFAHDPEHPELDRWYMSLKNKHKTPCCDISDGHAIQPDEWKSENGHYLVMLDGKWENVPDEAVLDQPNLAQHAIVWRTHLWNGMTIICFMPGPGM
jgi:hypothetical protein